MGRNHLERNFSVYSLVTCLIFSLIRAEPAFAGRRKAKKPSLPPITAPARPEESCVYSIQKQDGKPVVDKKYGEAILDLYIRTAKTTKNLQCTLETRQVAKDFYLCSDKDRDPASPRLYSMMTAPGKLDDIVINSTECVLYDTWSVEPEVAIERKAEPVQTGALQESFL